LKIFAIHLVEAAERWDFGRRIRSRGTEV